MTDLDIIQQRLSNQHLAGNPLKKPEDVVAWLGAVQAQDYAGAKEAIRIEAEHFGKFMGLTAKLEVIPAA